MEDRATRSVVRQISIGGENYDRSVISVCSYISRFSRGTDEWMRAALSEDALRLGRILAQLLPNESEVHALVALMELLASRNAARRGKNGEAVLLPDQDRSLWDYVQIQ